MATRSWFGWFKKSPPPPAPSVSEEAKGTGLEDSKPPPHAAGGEAKADGLGAAKSEGLDDAKVPSHVAGGEAKGAGLGEVKVPPQPAGESAKGDGLGAAKGEGLDEVKSPPHAAGGEAKADGLGAAKGEGLDDAKVPSHVAGGEAKGAGLGEVKVPPQPAGESAKADGLGAAKGDGSALKQSVPGESAKADGLGAAKEGGLGSKQSVPGESVKGDGLGAAKGDGSGSKQSVPGESVKGDGLGAAKGDGLGEVHEPGVFPVTQEETADDDAVVTDEWGGPAMPSSSKKDGMPSQPPQADPAETDPAETDRGSKKKETITESTDGGLADGEAKLPPIRDKKVEKFSDADADADFDTAAVQFELKLSDVSIRNRPAGKELAELDGDELIDLPSEAAARGAYEQDDDVLGMDRINRIDRPGKQAVTTDHEDGGLDDFGLPVPELQMDAFTPKLVHAEVGRGKGQEIEVENDETHIATGEDEGELVFDGDVAAAVEVELPDLGGDDPGWREGTDEFKVEIEGDTAGSLLTEDDANGLDG